MLSNVKYLSAVAVRDKILSLYDRTPERSPMLITSQLGFHKCIKLYLNVPALITI